MSTGAEILDLMKAAFADDERPEHFTNYQHCDECFEHDELLRSRDLDTLSRNDVGDGAWDPITMSSTQGFAYYLPALARLGLMNEGEGVWGWWGRQLFFHLNWDGPRNARWEFCSPAQRKAVLTLLEHILNTRGELVRSYNCEHDLIHSIDIWSEDSDRSSSALPMALPPQTKS